MDLGMQFKTEINLRNCLYTTLPREEGSNGVLRVINQTLPDGFVNRVVGCVVDVGAVAEVLGVLVAVGVELGGYGLGVAFDDDVFAVGDFGDEIHCWDCEG